MTKNLPLFLVFLMPLFAIAQSDPYSEIYSIKPREIGFSLDPDSIANPTIYDKIKPSPIYASDLMFSKFSKRNEFFQESFFLDNLSNEKIGIYYDGVPIKNPYFGNFDFSLFPSIFFRDIRLNLSSADNGNFSLGRSLDLKSDIPLDSLKAGVNLNGADFFGNASFNTSGHNATFYWDVSGNYTAANSYSIPDNDWGMDNLNSSNFNNLAIKGILGVKDNNSDISFSYLTFRDNRGLPNRIDLENEYSEIDRWSSNIYSFNYKTELNRKINLNGTFFYKNYKLIAFRFDNENRNTFFEPSSYSYDNNNYTYGGIVDLSYKFQSMPELHLKFNYNRDIINLKSSEELLSDRIEIENLTFSINQEYYFNELQSLGYNFAYKSIFLVDAANIKQFEDFNLFNAQLNYLHIFQDGKIILNNSIAYKTDMPELINYYPINRSFMVNSSNTIESNLINVLKINYLPNIRSNIESRLTVSQIRNREYILPTEELGLENRDELFASFALKYSYQLYRISLMSELTLNYFSEDLPSQLRFMTPPSNMLYTSFSYNFSRIAQVYINYRYIGERKQFQDLELEAVNLLDVNLSTRFYGKHTVYLQFNNILNQFYEVNYLIPAPGFFISGGINLNL